MYNTPVTCWSNKLVCKTISLCCSRNTTIKISCEVDGVLKISNFYPEIILQPATRFYYTL